jgi:hypothetical protein
MIDTLRISKNAQQLGLAYLKNEGDLDGDGADELSYVINWADWSAFNHSYIVTYKKGRWLELYSFEIRDWQLPHLPEYQNVYGWFGVQGINSTLGNDTLNQRLQNELDNFSGFIKKIKNNIIQVKFINDDAEDDSVIVNLKRIKKIKNNTWK